MLGWISQLTMVSDVDGWKRRRRWLNIVMAVRKRYYDWRVGSFWGVKASVGRNSEEAR